MKKAFWIVALILVLGVGSLGLAANSHTVTVSINSFARVSVSGSASVTIFQNDFDENGYMAVKDLTSNVQIVVKTNAKNGCKVTAQASNDFSAKFPVSKLQARVKGSDYKSLATTPVELIDFPENSTNPYLVDFRLVELSEIQDAGNYTTTITYTAAVNS